MTAEDDRRTLFADEPRPHAKTKFGRRGGSERQANRSASGPDSVTQTMAFGLVVFVVVALSVAINTYQGLFHENPQVFEEIEIGF